MKVSGCHIIPPLEGISSRNLEFLQRVVTELLGKKMGIFEFHLILALPSVFWSPLGVPPNLHNWDAALFRPFYFTIQDLRRFFHEVEALIDLDLVEGNHESLVRQTFLQV